MGAIKNGLGHAVILAAVLAGAGGLPREGRAAAAWQERLNYQGQLTDPAGNAVPDGTYDMRFRIYTAASGGSPIWGPETHILGNTITVNKGLFNVILGSISPIVLTPAQQMADKWLSIEVYNALLPGWDGEMSPRQPLLGSLFSRVSDTLQGLLPNNTANNIVVLDGTGKIPAGLVQGSSVSIPLDLSGNGGSYNLRANNTNAIATSLGGRFEGYNGALGTSVYADGKGLIGATYQFDNANAVGVSASANAGKAVFALSASGIGVVAQSGTGVGLSATTASTTNPAVYADSARYGGVFKTQDGSVGVALEAQGPGSAVARLVDRVNNAQVYGQAANNGTVSVWGNHTGAGTGVYGTSAGAAGYGVWGNNTGLTGLAYGVYGTTASNAGTAIFGVPSSASGAVIGVHGRSSSPSGRGVFGENTATTGSDAYGVHGKTSSTWGYAAGVWGEGPYIGVKGSSPQYGGMFEATYMGVWGRATNTAGTTWGVYGESYGTNGAAGYFWANGNGAVALQADNSGTNTTTGSFSAYGGGNAKAIQATSYGANGTALTAENYGSAPGLAIWANGYGGGVSAQARSAGDGVYGTGIASGVRGTTTGTYAPGVKGESSGSNAPAVLGVSTSYSYQAPGVAGTGAYLGVSGVSTSGGYGVYGYGWAGVYGEGSYGVYAYSPSYVGVYGNGPSYGVQGYGGTYGVYGSGTSYGVYGYSASGNGLYGVGSTGAYVDGDSYGVYVAPVTGYGFYYYSAPSTPDGHIGVYSRASCGNCISGYFYNTSGTASSGGGYAIYSQGRNYFGATTGSFAASGASYVLSNVYIDSSDEILLTPRTDPGTSRWYVSSIGTGTATITFNPALAASTTFSYFIIGD